MEKGVEKETIEERNIKDKKEGKLYENYIAIQLSKEFKAKSFKIDINYDYLNLLIEYLGLSKHKSKILEIIHSSENLKSDIKDEIIKVKKMFEEDTNNIQKLMKHCVKNGQDSSYSSITNTNSDYSQKEIINKKNDIEEQERNKNKINKKKEKTLYTNGDFDIIFPCISREILEKFFSIHKNYIISLTEINKLPDKLNVFIEGGVDILAHKGGKYFQIIK